MLKRAGKDGKTTVFLLTDTQIKEEAFLEDVDGLLNAGEVPNLFALDERAEIIEVSIAYLMSINFMGFKILWILWVFLSM